MDKISSLAEQIHDTVKEVEIDFFEASTFSNRIAQIDEIQIKLERLKQSLVQESKKWRIGDLIHDIKKTSLSAIKPVADVAGISLQFASIFAKGYSAFASPNMLAGIGISIAGEASDIYSKKLSNFNDKSSSLKPKEQILVLDAYVNYLISQIQEMKKFAESSLLNPSPVSRNRKKDYKSFAELFIYLQKVDARLKIPLAFSQATTLRERLQEFRGFKSKLALVNSKLLEILESRQEENLIIIDSIVIKVLISLFGSSVQGIKFCNDEAVFLIAFEGGDKQSIDKILQASLSLNETITKHLEVLDKLIQLLEQCSNNQKLRLRLARKQKIEALKKALPSFLIKALSIAVVVYFLVKVIFG